MSSFFNQGKCKLWDKWRDLEVNVALPQVFCELSNMPPLVTEGGGEGGGVRSQKGLRPFNPLQNRPPFVTEKQMILSTRRILTLGLYLGFIEKLKVHRMKLAG